MLSGEMTVFIDAGTTALELVPLLPEDSKCQFVTTCLGVANLLRERGFAFYLVGGTYIEMNDSFCGSMAIATIRSLSFDIALLCVTAINPDRFQISIGCEAYGQVQKEVIAVSRQSYVLTNHPKFRASAFFSPASFAGIEGVITSDLNDAADIQSLTTANLDVIVAQSS